MTGSSTPLDRLFRIAAALRPYECFLFFRHDGRFLDPLVPDQSRRLEEAEGPREPGVDVVLDELVARLPGLAPGIYAPVPIARALRAGEGIERALAEHRYEMIAVDEEQRWWWQGRPVAERLRHFFLEHLGWESSIGRYFFEYRVGREFWDKSYLRHRITPVVARTLEAADGRWLADTNTTRRVEVDPSTFRLDRRERLFVTARELGEVMIAGPLRFRLLAGVAEDLRSFQLGNRWVPLRWPSGFSAGPGRG